MFVNDFSATPASITAALMATGCLGLLLHTAVNLWVFRRPRLRSADRSPKAADAWVSVLIPARNEEGRIGNCLDSLCGQPGFDELLVLDDRSEDQTAAEIDARAQRDSRIRRVSGAEPPRGWTGKAWACHQLSQLAGPSAECRSPDSILIFTDADTWHAPGGIEVAVAWMRQVRADLLSLWPRQEVKTWGEQLVVPFVHVLLLVFLPHWMPGRWRSLGAANGQFLAMRRDAYEAIGGHASVSGNLVEDVALARRVKVAGLRLVNADGSRLVHCRMYENWPQIWEGFSKNLRAGCDGSLAAFLSLTGLQAGLFLLPFVWFLVALVLDHPTAALALAGCFFVWCLRALLAWRVGHPALSVLLHAVGQLLVLAIAINSWRSFASGTVTWKGRTYGASGSGRSSAGVFPPQDGNNGVAA